MELLGLEQEVFVFSDPLTSPGQLVNPVELLWLTESIGHCRLRDTATTSESGCRRTPDACEEVASTRRATRMSSNVSSETHRINQREL